MAGFAVVMTFLSYVFFGLIAASIASLCLYLFAKRRFPEAGEVRRRVIIASVLVPFLAFLWPIAAFIIHAQISNRLAHQDCGLGLSPDPYVTLPNGYILGSANTYDGYFKAPGFETDMPIAGPGYVRSIIDLKFSNGYFTGTQFDFKTSSVRHFTFDTRTREFHTTDPEGPASHVFQSGSSSDVDKWAATQTSVRDDADSYWKLYARYRHDWPDYIFAVLIIAGEGAIGFWLWKSWTTANHSKQM
jgi:hypothetical protein